MVKESLTYFNINKNFNSLTVISIDERHIVSSLSILLQLGDRDALVPSGLGTVEGHFCGSAIGVGCLERFAVPTFCLLIIEGEVLANSQTLLFASMMLFLSIVSVTLINAVFIFLTGE